MLSQLSKDLVFTYMSNIDNNDTILFSSSKFIGSKCLLLAESYVSEKQSFNSTKSFALNIELLAVPGKTVGIVKSSFTSKASMNKTRELAICEKIVVNNNLKKVNNHSDKEIIVKKIPVDLSKSAVKSVFSKFGKVVSIKMQLIGLWQKALIEFDLLEVANSVVSKWSVLIGKNSVWMALAVKDKQSWMLRDQHRALLYTLPVSTTAYDLSGLLDSYGGKTCFIGCNTSSYVYNRCVVICFIDKTSKLAAIRSVPVFKSTSLQWAGFSLTCCTKCKQFGHIFDACLSGEISGIRGKQMQAPIAHSVSFGGKTWAQVVGSFSFCVVPLVSFGAVSFFAAKKFLSTLALPGTHNLYGRLASLEHSLELLADQVSGILMKLGFLELVPLAAASGVSPSEVSVTVVPGLDLDMVLNGESMIFTPSSLVVNDTAITINPSSSKVLTTKVGGLESKMVALEVSVESVLEKLDHLCSDLGFSAAFISQ
ncbi:hypothetical protein G9A89_006859 [Geosiphon pyriformis]|nr:hypothetical protein G9A89_006859 [Geosiphon pyriformis]